MLAVYHITTVITCVFIFILTMATITVTATVHRFKYRQLSLINVYFVDDHMELTTKRWSDQADLRLADLRARRRALEDSYTVVRVRKSAFFSST